MLRWVINQHKMCTSLGIGRACSQLGKRIICPHIAIHQQERFVPEQMEGIEKTACGFQWAPSSIQRAITAIWFASSGSPAAGMMSRSSSGREMSEPAFVRVQEI